MIRIIPYILSKTIRPPKVAKTKGDILKYALKEYLCAYYTSSLCTGLCYFIYDAISHYIQLTYLNDIKEFKDKQFHLFRNSMALDFNGREEKFWWKRENWKDRYRFMKWLIKQYKNEPL